MVTINWSNFSHAGCAFPFLFATELVAHMASKIASTDRHKVAIAVSMELLIVNIAVRACGAVEERANLTKLSSLKNVPAAN